MKKKISIFLIIILCLLLIAFIFTYKLLFADNINDNQTQKQHLFFVHTGSSYNDVLLALKKQHLIKDMSTFKLLAEKLNYKQNVKPGRYAFDNSSGNLTILRKLRSGSQEPVKITFNNIQNKEQLAEKIAAQIEASKSEILQEFNNKQFLDSLQLTEDNFSTIFLANTYQFYWNTSTDEFLARMLKEYSRFWNDDRKNKAEKLGLSPTEVTILASIVQKESSKYDEYARIAGVYYNRLKKNMKLQADPTVLYAKQKLGLSNRVYNKDTKIEHPYNTYYVLGLPPGPICLPETKSIDLCLDLEHHDYIFFCAKDDFSGYHSFAADWATHEKNAEKFHQALNANNIK